MEKEDSEKVAMIWRRGDILQWKRVYNFMITTLDWSRLGWVNYGNFLRFHPEVGKELFDTRRLKENSDKE